MLAATSVTGTLTITNAANITGTHAETIVVNGDTRTWTNFVANPATQILTNSVISFAVQQALLQFSDHAVTNLSLFSDGSTYISWRGPAVTITLSTNNWGSLSYVTNSVGPGAPIKLLYSTAALLPDGSGTNYVADFLGADYQTITASADVNFLQSTNRQPVRSITFVIDPNGTTRNFTLPAAWKKTAINPAITNGTIGVLSLTVTGSAEANVIAAFTTIQ